MEYTPILLNDYTIAYITFYVYIYFADQLILIYLSIASLKRLNSAASIDTLCSLAG